MRKWLRRLLVGWTGGALAGSLLASAAWGLLLYNWPVSGVTAFDAFMLILAFVSLAANVIQWLEREALMIPIRNPLIGLFNELKARQQRVLGRQNRLNDKTTVAEFADFTDETILGFEQLREHVISLIETVAPGIRDDEFYRASTRGLTMEEKAQRAEFFERRRWEDGKDAAATTAMQPARTLYRRYEGNLEAIIIRGFANGFEWNLEDKTDKVVIADGAAPTIELAQQQADAAAGRPAEGVWRSR